jgi:p-aminobenzoyl-glutamate transporter AbgT
LSRGSGGETVLPNQLDALFERIQTKNSLKPIMYQTAKANPVINIKWIFFALFLLLAIEWFLRRYFGGY